MSIMGQRAVPRGAQNTWDEVPGRLLGPDGSNLFVSLFVRGKEECADVEESIGKTKRRLIRIEGEFAHVRAVAWMDGYVSGRDHLKRPPIVQTTKVKNVSRRSKETP